MLTSQYIQSVLPVNINHIYLAYSGGQDSHVLLHLLSTITQFKSKVTAVYVDHGLQVEAQGWETHCQAIALKSNVHFQCLKVNAEKKNRQSQEEVARNVRYQALESLLVENDILLLAQHREDQMETVLLQLFRGAGVQGLAGMPLYTVFGKGRMIRPLLDVSKVAINDYAEEHQLQWIEDPSNNNNDFDRNFLRNQVVPLLKQRWPALDKTVSRSSRHCANSHFLNIDLSAQLLNALYNEADQSLDIQQLLDLDSKQQFLVIRQWFNVMQLRMPSEKIILCIINEVLKAKQSANPQLKYKAYCLRRYRNKLYCLNTDSMDAVENEKVWSQGLDQLMLKRSILTLCEASQGIPKVTWNNSSVWVKFRKGSEKIRLPGRQGHHSLKKIFQEKSIPPWERKAVPLLYINGELAAIADLWISDDFMDYRQNECFQLQWSR